MRHHSEIKIRPMANGAEFEVRVAVDGFVDESIYVKREKDNYAVLIESETQVSGLKRTPAIQKAMEIAREIAGEYVAERNRLREDHAAFVEAAEMIGTTVME